MVVGFLKGLAHLVAWAVAAGAAVTLAWWGVHTVMEGTVYDPPSAVPVAGSSGTSQPVTSATRRPKPTPTATGTPTPTPPARSPRPTKSEPRRTPPPSASSNAPDDEPEDGVIRPYDTKGGRVVLDIGKTKASLVSASPRSGWSMRVWKTSTWIRVEFTSDTAEVSLICDWYHQQPQVQIVDG